MNRSLLFIIFFSILLNLYAENWLIQSVDSSHLGGLINDASIAMDTQGRPHIIYTWDRRIGTNQYQYWIKYAKWNGQAWEFQAIDTIVTDAGSVFLTTKLCLDYQNYPHTAYIIRDYNSQTGCSWIKVIYTYWNGASWQKSTIDSFNVNIYYTGAFIDQRNLDLTINHFNIPYLSYPYINLADSIWQVRCAYKDVDTWIIKTVRQQPLTLQTYRTRIAFDTSNVLYMTFDVNRNNQPPTLILCARFDGDTWKIEPVDSFPSSITNVYSLKIDRINRLHLLFNCDFYVFYALKQGSEWQIVFLGSSDNSSNHGDLALYQNEPYIVYSSPMTHVSYFYKDTVWYREIIDSEYPGLYPSIAIDLQGNKHVSYVRFGYPCYLCYARRIAPGIEENREPLSIDRIPLEIYPNPTKTFSAIRYSLPVEGKVSLQLYDISGRLEKTLIDECKSPGNYFITLNTQTFSSGVYFLSLQTELKRIVKRFIVTK